MPIKRFLFSLIALLCVSSAAYAAFARFQLAGTPQITCNMSTGVASVGSPCNTPPALGVCNGDVQTVTRTVTISGTTLTTSTNTFVSGDVGKTVYVVGSSLPDQASKITGFTDAKTVTLQNSSSAFGPTSVAMLYGNNDTPVFQQFNTWALANQGTTNQVVQTLPTSGGCWFATQVGGGFIAWVGSIKNLIVEGSNATLDGLTVPWYAGSTLGALCQKGLADASGCSARIQTVSAGLNTVTLTAASLALGYISRFSATPGANGNWILVAGLNTQAVITASSSGYPPNPTYFEYRQITAINAGTGVITLGAALTNSYLSTWPNYSSGDSGNADAGGPGTIYAMNDAWNTTVEYKNLTMKKSDQIAGNGRFVTYRNVSFNGSIPAGATNNCGALPSQNVTWSAYTVDWTYCTIENDKIATNVFLDAVTGNRLDFQSNSITNLTLTNSTITSFFGTPLNTTITDSTFGTFRPGASGYGGTSKVVCTRCAVTTFQGTGGVQSNLPSVYSMSGGVVSFLNSDVTGAGPPSRLFGPVPGNILYITPGSFSGSIGLFNAQTITQDPTNTFVQTNEAGGLPTFSGYAGLFQTHPAPQFTCDACTGDATFVAMNTQLGATPLKPLAEFSKRSYTPSAQGSIGDLLSRGKIVSLTIDVTAAGTAAGSLSLNATGTSHQETVQQSTWTAYDWVPTINLKQTGTRVITPSGTTCNGVAGSGPGGSCAGDTCTVPASGCFVLPEAVWIKESLNPFMVGTPTGNPTFSIEIKTNQGVVP